MPQSISPRSNSLEEESAPLLSPAASITESRKSAEKRRTPWLLVAFLIFFIVVIDWGALIAEAPKTRIYEANLCIRYYEKHDPSMINNDGTVDEKLCKINPVQDRLAMIMGWSDLFEAAPAILLAVPFGTMADRFGRKWIFVISLLGLFLYCSWFTLICYLRTVPLQWTWLGAAFFLLGGGPMVASAIVVTMISDVVAPGERTSIFMNFTAAVIVAEMLAPIASAALMKYSDWLPLLLSLGVLCVAILMAIGLPETMHMRDIPEPIDEEEEQEDDSDVIELRPKDAGFGFKAQLAHFRDALHFFKRDFTLALVIFTFLANRLGRQSINLLLRYASKRYDWSIREASYLLSLRAGANLVALLAIIPAFNMLLVKVLKLPVHKADLWIARLSIVLTSISFFIMGVSAVPGLLIFGLLIYNLGTGYNAAMRSTAIVVVGGQSSPDIGRLMAVIAIMEGFGQMAAGPLLNGTLSWGLSLGKAFYGLPFICSALVFLPIGVITFMISARDIHPPHANVQGSDDET